MSESSAFVIPAEWAPQSRIWTAWPSHPELWPGTLLQEARSEIAAMVRIIAGQTPFHVLAFGEEAVQSAAAALGDVATIVPARFGDVWLRDTGPIFTGTGGCLRFASNGWGGKYIYEFDDEVGDTIAGLATAPISRFPFVLEGGALEHNGKGALLTTRQCLLNPNRNGWDETTATVRLQQAFNATAVYWLDDGVLYDHTDGHVDNLARFVGENTVVCQRAFGEDDPNAQLHEKTASDLQALGLDVVQIPSPGLVKDEEGSVMPASHMNFIISNGAVIVPVYGTASAEQAVAELAELFPGRQVVGVKANALLTGGGSFHCITQQEPVVGEHS